MAILVLAILKLCFFLIHFQASGLMAKFEEFGGCRTLFEQWLDTEMGINDTDHTLFFLLLSYKNAGWPMNAKVPVPV